MAHGVSRAIVYAAMAAEHQAERLAAVEANVTDLRGNLDKFALDIELTRQKSMDLIGEKAFQIEDSAKLANAKVQELYEIANRAISHLTGRVATLEANSAERQFGQPNSPKSLVPAKAMIPSSSPSLKTGSAGEWT